MVLNAFEDFYFKKCIFVQKMRELEVTFPLTISKMLRVPGCVVPYCQTKNLPTCITINQRETIRELGGGGSI